MAAVNIWLAGMIGATLCFLLWPGAAAIACEGREKAVLGHSAGDAMAARANRGML